VSQSQRHPAAVPDDFRPAEDRTSGDQHDNGTPAPAAVQLYINEFTRCLLKEPSGWVSFFKYCDRMRQLSPTVVTTNSVRRRRAKQIKKELRRQELKVLREFGVPKVPDTAKQQFEMYSNAVNQWALEKYYGIEPLDERTHPNPEPQEQQDPSA
jgi:hypothetical protein